MSVSKYVEKYRGILWVVAIISLLLILNQILLNSGVFEWIETNFNENMALGIVLLVALKAIGIILPPLSTGVLFFLFVPAIGWFNVFVIDYIGEVIGSVIAFWIAKRYGEKAVKRLAGKHAYNKIVSYKVPEEKQFEFLFLMRFVGWLSLIHI